MKERSVNNLATESFNTDAEYAINCCDLQFYCKAQDSLSKALRGDFPHSFTRLYFGSYFCSRSFCNYGSDELDSIRAVCKSSHLNITLVIPIATNNMLEAVKEKIDLYIGELDGLIDEVCVNDAGMYRYFSAKYELSIIAGRLLCKELRDPRLPNLIDDLRLSTSAIDWNIENRVCSAIEVEGLPRLIHISEDIPESTIVAIHFPYVYISCTRTCQFAYRTHRLDGLFRVDSPCTMRCQSQIIKYRIDNTFGGNITIIKLGQGIYWNPEMDVENLLKTVVGAFRKRLVVMPKLDVFGECGLR